MLHRVRQRIPKREFQCSSASRKFLNTGRVHPHLKIAGGFSALQRAENSSIISVDEYHRMRDSCFSALQRAENSSIAQRLSALLLLARFSALQRAENSSILPLPLCP